MKKMYQYGFSAALLLSSLGAWSQNRSMNPGYALGSSQALVQQLEAQAAKGSAQRTAPLVTLRVSASEAFTGKVNFRQDLSTTGEYVIGELAGVPGSSFQLRIEGTEAEGNIVLRDTKQAYQYTADAQGNVVVQEVDINKVLCIEYDKPAGYQNPAPAATGTNKAANRTAVVPLQSLPGARGCVMLDFDGQYVAGTPWNNGNPINAAPSGMSDAAIQECWELVSEDFRPFSLNVTTDEAVFNTYPKNMRRRCIITPTNTAAPGAGGVAYVGSFNDNNDTPCWVFITSGKSGGEATSHEVGHTLGLGHDGRTTPAEGYFAGHGSWAPIMGVGYYKPITQWSRGEYNSANNTQDDLTIITSSAYNVGYRNDDHANGTAGATALTRNGTSLSGAGIIERTTDQDFFAISTGAGTLSLNVNTVARHGDLDIVARLYNSAGAVIGTYNAPGLNTSLSVSVTAGTYYLSVDGIGTGNPATDGYSDYGSLGTFTIAGTAPVGGSTPPPPPPPPVTGVATIYKDCPYAGTAVGLNAGDYTMNQLGALGMENDKISSLKVSPGYEVQLFVDDNFAGASVVLSGETSCFDGTWNDKVSSLKVRTSGVTTLSGIYTLQNRNSGLNLDVDGASQADRAPLIQWPNNGCDCQKFRFTHLGSGVYKIEAVHSGKGLDVNEISTAAGAGIVQWPYVGGANQQFTVLDAGGGFVKLRAKHSGQVVEVAGASRDNRARVQQWADNGSATQQWKLIPVPASAPSFSTLPQSSAAQAASQAPLTTALALYPNPVLDRLTLVSAADFTGQPMRVLNATGQVVWKGTYSGEPVNVAALKPGLYTLVLYTREQHKLVSRFSKQ